jgi:hypothetical protein
MTKNVLTILKNYKILKQSAKVGKNRLNIYNRTLSVRLWNTTAKASTRSRARAWAPSATWAQKSAPRPPSSPSTPGTDSMKLRFRPKTFRNNFYLQNFWTKFHSQMGVNLSDQSGIDFQEANALFEADFFSTF